MKLPFAMLWLNQWIIRLRASPSPQPSPPSRGGTSASGRSIWMSWKSVRGLRRPTKLVFTATALVICLLAGILLPAAEPQNTSAIQSLKPGKGREQVQINCIPCHSTAIIAATHATRARWDELITTMQQKHGLWPLVPTIRTQLLDYLAATQPPTEPDLDAGKQTPWAQPLYRPNPLW